MAVAKRYRILIVDDDALICSALQQALKAENRRIDVAPRGEDAARLIAKADYNVVLVDVMMPGMSGLDFVRSLKERGSRSKAVVMTGYPTSATAERADRLGVYAFLPKPFLMEEVRRLVERALDLSPDDSDACRNGNGG